MYRWWDGGLVRWVVVYLGRRLSGLPRQFNAPVVTHTLGTICRSARYIRIRAIICICVDPQLIKAAQLWTTHEFWAELSVNTRPIGAAFPVSISHLVGQINEPWAMTQSNVERGWPNEMRSLLIFPERFFRPYSILILALISRSLMEVCMNTNKLSTQIPLITFIIII